MQTKENRRNFFELDKSKSSFGEAPESDVKIEEKVEEVSEIKEVAKDEVVIVENQIVQGAEKVLSDKIPEQSDFSAKPGRRLKEDSERFDNRVTILFDDYLYDIVRAKAKENRQGLSRFLYDIVLHSLTGDKD